MLFTFIVMLVVSKYTEHGFLIKVEEPVPAIPYSKNS